MERVGTALGGYVDHAAGGASVFSAEVAGGDFEFLHGIQWDLLADLSGEQVYVLGAIEQHVGRSRALAVDGEASATNGGISGAVAVIFNYVAGSPYQIVGVAGKGGQLDDALGVNC